MVATPVNPTSLNAPGAATGLPARRPSGDRQRSARNEGALATLAFDVLLAALRTQMPGPRGGGGGKTSASQMFEPNAAGAHERREMALKEEYRASLDRSAIDRHDVAGAERRRAVQTGRSVHAGRTSNGEWIQSVQNDGTSSDRWSTIGRRSEVAGTPEFDRLHSFARPGEGARPNLGMARGAVPAPPAETVISSSSFVSVAEMAGSVSAAVVDPTGESGGPRSSLPARQVATILSVGRADEVESIRTMTSSSSVSDPRQSWAERDPSESPSASRKNDASPTERQSDGNDARVGDVRKTAFDQLVRSIRLQIGSRHSSARLQLEPPELGRLHVFVRVDGERLRVDVRTETAAARDLVSKRAVQLAAALERQGIAVERFEVTAESSAEQRPDRADGDHSRSDLPTNQEGGQRGEWSSSRASHAAPADHHPSPPDVLEQDPPSRAEWKAIIGPARLDIRV